jgi:glycosyltransferase involved in cell wall biosynthesis
MKQTNPKVSVCVVTYNQNKFISECLQSIVDQKTSFSFEVLVGDDCSTDGAQDMIREFSKKYPHLIKLVLHSKNIGSTLNYLSVHNLATGDYVCECDGDDFWLPGKLAIQTKVMEENLDLVQTWHRQLVVNAHSDVIGMFPKRFPSFIFGKPLSFIDLAHSYGLVGQHSSQMYRRSARSVRERSKLTIDYFFALDISSQGLSLHLPNTLGCYRVISGGSMTQNSKGRDSVDIALLEAALYFSAKYPATKTAFKANVMIRALGAIYRRRTNYRFLYTAIRDYPFSFFSLIRSTVIFAISKL